MLKTFLKRPRFAAAILFFTLYFDLCLSVSARAGTNPGTGSQLLNRPRTAPVFDFKLPASVEKIRRVPDFSQMPEKNNEVGSKTNLTRKKEEDTDGPGQPEMASFQSVNSSNMVDLFTGDFSYNLPLLDVGGYPVNIHYSSGISMDQEASWVGLGWNINPGTISRSVRGVPDDFNGQDSLTTTLSIRDNKTVGGNVGGSGEIAGLPFLNLSAKFGVFHNNYNGWGIEQGINAAIDVGKNSKGNLTSSLGLGISNNSQTGLNVTPSLSFKLSEAESGFNGSSRLTTNYNSRAGLSALTLSTEVRQNKTHYFTHREEERNLTRSSGMGISSSISFATPSVTPSITMPITNMQFAFTLKPGGAAGPVFPNMFFEGYVSRQFIAKEDSVQRLPAYGYLHYSKAAGNKVLLDFNREKDIPFNERTTPHIAIPQYTYDIYSMSGEGTGGMFRPYRGDVGYIYDHAARTKSGNTQLSGDLGFGGYFHAGIDFSKVNVITQSGPWKSGNPLLKNIGFSKTDSTFQEVYFRNPGEKAINTSDFYKRIGDDSLVRVKLAGSVNSIATANSFTKFYNARPAGDIAISSPLVKKERDKRTQLITYLSSAEASRYGLDKMIRSYHQNSNPITDCDDAYENIERADGEIRKEHHLSEIRVLNGDGRRYVYGLPVYNVEQLDVTFAVKQETNGADLDKGLAAYDAGHDNTTGNDEGKDRYFKKDRMPPYAHTFLLTGILSPDYVDIKGDGITEDDIGDGIKFNYSRIYGPADEYFNWRTPAHTDKVNYNEGLKTYNRDDKGTYLFGKKEVWYMHSLESKTMIAFFKTSDRADAKSAAGENGGFDNGKRLKKLDSIELYVKSDMIKNGSAARPVKTVHFEYSYELCPGYIGSDSSGKLTLKRIWFTYNGNNKGKLNPYRFYYHPDPANDDLPKASGNPSYNPRMYDRWGNYKDPLYNPGELNNSDFPYAEQDSARAARNAAAWTLTDIKLPSGGRMNITYESDDYAYVQDRRAAQMLPLLGFGSSPAASPANLLYSTSGADHYYVFVDASSNPVHTPADIYNKYLEGLEKIYFKLAVQMPADKWGSGYEFVPTYGEIDGYGTVTGNNNRFWIKLKPVGSESPLTKSAIQFLRLNLPSKAYPASELGDDIDLGGAVKMLISGLREIANSVNGFNNQAKIYKWCQKTVAGKSFIRLNNPAQKKLGGGIRVKRVQVFDNWNKMTTKSGSPGLKESVYGQEYQYTTIREINGQKKMISSGVAAYEPMIGADENPFREPIEYIEKVAPLAPANLLYTEKPLGESFFPAPMVGYSKVRVRTINAKARSANGWEETEFFTTRDFPTIVDFTPMDGDSKKRYNPKLKNFLRIDSRHHLTLSQGFRVQLNDMNGKTKAQSSYPENDPVNAINSTLHFYKVDDDNAYQKRLNNSVWVIDSLNGHINTNGEIGKEVEIMVDVRQQVSTTSSGSASVNLDLIPAALLPFPLSSFFNFPQFEENKYRSIAVMKVVQRYGILDSIVVNDKGSVVSTKNLVYDAETGAALVTRTSNEFKDPVYNFSYPAHWAYSGMGMAYRNADAVLSGKKIIGGRLLELNDAVFPVERFFESGDEVWVTGRKMAGSISQPNDCPLYIPGAKDTLMLWVIDAAKGKDGGNGLFFIDKEGQAYSGFIDALKIIRSGRRNHTDASVGSIVSLASPVRNIGEGLFKIVIDEDTKVLNAGAAVFKDKWHVDNPLYQADSCYTKTTTDNNFFYPETSLLMRGGQHKLHNKHSTEIALTSPRNTFNSPNYTAGSESNVFQNHIITGSGRYRHHLSKSILQFNFSSIPAGAVINSASLNLFARCPKEVWTGNNDQFNLNWSNKDYAHYMNGNLSGKTNNSTISWVTSPWNQYTHYDNIVTSGSIDVPSATNETCTDRTVTVTSLVQGMVNNPSLNKGFLLRLRDESRTGNSSTRILSFGGTGFSGGMETFMQSLAVPDDCCGFNPPHMQVSYTYQKDTCVKVCKVSITDTTNPYRWGILGNWRMDKAFTYYYERVESDASETQTNIRREGVLNDFYPYWQFSSAALVPATDTTRWVWNSAVSLYNRKGYEVENYDPLGRYNAGLYGYNQTLPVAVAQNSRYRQMLFDGFEDYGYRTRNCDTACQNIREIDFLKGNASFQLNNTESHTGRYSLAVSAAGQGTFTAPMDLINDSAVAIRAFVNPNPIYTFQVNGKGTGLQGEYSCMITGDMITRTDPDVDIDFRVEGNPMECIHPLRPQAFNSSVIWRGKIQPKYNDTYFFHVRSDQSGAGIKIGNVQVLPESSSSGVERTSAPIYLEAGKLYDIIVSYPSFRESSSIRLSWSGQSRLPKETIPQSQLYLPTITGSDTLGSVIAEIAKLCTSLDTMGATNFLRPQFSPVKESKIVVSAWMKVNVADCAVPGEEEQGEILVTFDQGADPVSLKKTGVPIEGWQRLEAVIDVPAVATEFYITLKAAAANGVLVDDVRVHPFNSNMKSFVYDPENLRLMAELDDNNYASLYEYDDDGTLIRVKKETERGIKTIKETRSALFKEE